MKTLIIILLFLDTILCEKELATLKIITFVPPTFNLSFSSPTTLPTFQLLLNN